MQGCATLQHPTTYAVCTAVDLISTHAALEAGFVEANPIVAGILGSGGWPLLIAINVGIIWLLYKYRDKEEAKIAIGVGSVVRCAVGVNNLLLL